MDRYKLKKNVKRRIGGFDVARIIVVSDNAFFKMGMELLVNEIRSVNNSHFDNIDFYSLTTKDSLLKETLNETPSAIIVDSNIITAYALYLCHRHKNIILLSSNELNVTNVKELFYGTNDFNMKVKIPSYALLTTLSSKEKRLCKYLFYGFRPKLIGMLLGISEKTVSSHKRNIMRKIGCSRVMDFNKALVLYNKMHNENSTIYLPINLSKEQCE